MYPLKVYTSEFKTSRFYLLRFFKIVYYTMFFVVSIVIVRNVNHWNSLEPNMRKECRKESLVSRSKYARRMYIRTTWFHLSDKRDLHVLGEARWASHRFSLTNEIGGNFQQRILSLYQIISISMSIKAIANLFLFTLTSFGYTDRRYLIINSCLILLL